MARYLDMEDQWTNNQRQLAHLLDSAVRSAHFLTDRFQIPPTRAQLLRELLRINAIDYAEDFAKSLYT